MKRRLIPGLMLAITLSFAGCTDQLVSPIQENDIIVDDAIEVPSQVADGDPYQVLVESNETKTITEQGTNGKWSTYWVDAASASQNARSGPDMINLFSKKTGSQDYKSHGKFTYVGNQTFDGNLSGGLEDLGDSNDWYSIYPFNENSSSAATGITASVVIGASSANEYTQVQNGANSMSHLAGDYYPMYGIKNNVAKNKTPKFKMSHLYSVIALKIVNDTEGDIVVKYAELKANEDVVGDFKTNISGDEPSFVSETGKTSSIARVQFETPTKIEKDGFATLYMAIKPFDASNDEIVISINGEASKGNGASRTVKMPANVKFEAGKVTTLKVPVKNFSFHHERVNPATNNLIGIQSTTMKYHESTWFLDPSYWYSEKGDGISFSNSSEPKMIINGKETDVRILGTDSSTGSITIKGTAKELFSYIPIEFYASSWNNKRAVMKVEKVTAYFWLLVYIPISFTYDELAGKLMAAEKIKFSGLVPAEQFSVDGNNYITILDEEPYHKKVSEEQIENLLQNFDDVEDDYNITYQGLYDAITNPSSIKAGDYQLDKTLSPASVTAYIIYHKIFDVLHSSSNESALSKVAGVAELVFNTPQTLFNTVSTMPVEATLSTVKAGEDGATDNRLIIWGFNSPNVK